MDRTGGFANPRETGGRWLDVAVAARRSPVRWPRALRPPGGPPSVRHRCPASTGKVWLLRTAGAGGKQAGKFEVARRSSKSRILPHEGRGRHDWGSSDCQSISQPSPDLTPSGRFLHSDGGIRFSRVPGSSFSSGFGPKSIRRAQADPGPPGRARGLRTREKRKQVRSVGERTRKPYNLDANPPLPPVVALSPPAPPLANPPAGCLNFAIPPPTCPHQPIFRRPACRLAIFRRRGTPPVAPRRHAWQVFVHLLG
jgi:hypothetical protein